MSNVFPDNLLGDQPTPERRNDPTTMCPACEGKSPTCPACRGIGIVQVADSCGCITCLDAKPRPAGQLGANSRQRMVLCPTCGNKRCPKSKWHGFSCSGSNNPGQHGSAYYYEPLTDEQIAEAMKPKPRPFPSLEEIDAQDKHPQYLRKWQWVDDNGRRLDPAEETAALRAEWSRINEQPLPESAEVRLAKENASLEQIRRDLVEDIDDLVEITEELIALVESSLRIEGKAQLAAYPKSGVEYVGVTPADNSTVVKAKKLLANLKVNEANQGAE